MQLVTPGTTSGPANPAPSRSRTGWCAIPQECSSRTTHGSAKLAEGDGGDLVDAVAAVVAGEQVRSAAGCGGRVMVWRWVRSWGVPLGLPIALVHG